MFCDLRDIISKENTLSLKAESTISNVRLWACVRGWVFSPTHIYTNRLRYNFLRNCTRIRYGNNKSILQIEPLNNDIETDYQNCDVLWLFTMKKWQMVYILMMSCLTFLQLGAILAFPSTRSLTISWKLTASHYLEPLSLRFYRYECLYSRLLHIFSKLHRIVVRCGGF